MRPSKNPGASGVHPPPPHGGAPPEPAPRSFTPRIPLVRVREAVSKAHRDLLASGENVSAWGINSLALIELEAESFNALGFRIPQIQSLNRLMLLEAKVNTFIHCFVRVWKITSLHDLNVAICKSEGIHRFDELELGPLLRHPLVIYYFLVPSDTEEIVNITSTEIISYLLEFLDQHIHVTTDEFLDFIAIKRAEPVKEKLGIRIQSLKMYVHFIRDAKEIEASTVANYLSSKMSEGLGKCVCQHKYFLRKQFRNILMSGNSFSPIHKDSVGKHTRSDSFSLEDEVEHTEIDDKDVKDDSALRSSTKNCSQNRNISDQSVSSCVYPSASKVEMAGQSSPAINRVICEENKRVSATKRKCESQTIDKSFKLPKRDRADSSGHDLELLEDHDGGKSQCIKSKSTPGWGDRNAYVEFSKEAMNDSITTWKDECRLLPGSQVNAFIHCYVGVRKITSLHDLNVEICRSEGVQRFDELELGPFLRHPLVIHYFLVPPDTREIVNITCEEIISYLVEFVFRQNGKAITIEEFLDFVAVKQSQSVKEKLGIRIQNLRMYVKSIKEAKKNEETTLKNYIQSMKKTSKEKNGKGKIAKMPSISTQKKVLKKRYFAIAQRVKSFSPILKDSSGKHIRFISSSSEYEDEDNGVDEKDDNISRSQSKIGSQSRNMSDQRVSSCPYPSATEEKARLGLKVEMAGQSSPASGRVICDKSKKLSAKKRKCESQNTDYPLKLSKRDNTDSSGHDLELLEDIDVGKSQSKNQSGVSNVGYAGLTDDALEEFITTWKDACRLLPVSEVLDRMIHFYSTPQPGKKQPGLRTLQSVFKSFPCSGLLHIAVSSIKNGTWDSLYDTFQDIGERKYIPSSAPTEGESISVEPSSERDLLSNKECPSQLDHCIHIDDICKKVSAYFNLNHTTLVEGKSVLEKQFIFLRKLHDCQIWLTKQLSVKEFISLGHGEFHRFLEEHPSLIPNELLENLLGDVRKKSTLEVSMSQHQLIILLLQAEGCLQKNETLTMEHISNLLSKQFPVISLQVRGDVPSEDVSGFLKNHKNVNNPSSVLFSATSLRSHYGRNSLMHNNTHLLEQTGLKQDTGFITGALGSVSAKDAIECLFKAPMLSDLQSWTHWDLIYAPTLGSLVEWLLKEVHMKELMCLVTNDGRIIRIDNSATVDEFLEALLKSSAYEAAVKLLSLFSLYGGEGHVPLSLLKCHAQRGIENILINSIESMKVQDNHNFYLDDGKALKGQYAQETTAKHSYLNLLDKNAAILDIKDQHRLNIAVPVASRFILDCLCYLPSECHSFAAVVLLSGLESFTKDAPLTILRECKQTHQRLMLHHIGLSLNICEWIADYRAFSSAASTDLPQSISTGSTLVSSPLQSAYKFKHNELEEPSTSDDVLNLESDMPKEVLDKVMDTNVNQVSIEMCEGSDSILLEHNETWNGKLIVESIRREEFGLVSSLTEADDIMLKRQHARLGRALQCLSQELYSQDSHFLLELVQNADDNIYPEVVEPTLVFILQKTGIVVLNNEQGFTAQNIRALCDVGNSTKKGANAGYIGKKGIGFKSVFRVTDAPEIHSNGFNVKFDISEGQIGFVLPTVVSPCDIVSLRRLLPDEANKTDTSWNTCIVLPFKSKLRDGMGLSTILSLFSDLHPSLLLFLHRLQCIKFIDIVNDTYTVMKRENLADGIVKVSHGEEIMSWFVASQNLQASVLRPDVQTTKISLAFTLKESPDGDYIPHLEQQPVFAFLPLRRYGLKFILQGDFVLPSSREEVDSDSAWNQWLLSEFPSLFFSAQRSFCNLHCFQERPGKAVAAYMSFVPLVGEVHGFFSLLPKMIILKLRISNCLLVDGKEEWVFPCKVLRGWNEQARILLPDKLLNQHLGLAYLDKDIVLSDSLAKALGVSEYGPRILVDIISSICCGEEGVKPLGLDWLSSWLGSLYTMLAHSSGHSSVNAWVEADLIDMLKKVPFIPLSDGSYSSIAEGTIWLTSDAVNCGLEGQYESEIFVNLHANLRLVSPAFLSTAAVNTHGIEDLTVDSVLKMLFKIGVQRLVAHELIRVHILPALCDDRTAARDTNLMMEYLAFVMLHLQSTCTSCQTERDSLVSELQSKAFILTNHGYKRAGEVPIHFSRVFGNPVDMTKLIDIMNSDWHEVDFMYLKHSSNKSSSFGVMKWRDFFQDLGVTDFVRTVQVDRNIADVFHTLLGDITCGGDIIASGSVARDWESPELVHLLSTLSSQENSEKSKYLLEVLDKMWDACFSAKVIGCCVSPSGEGGKQFKSSFIKCINDFQWMASSIDQKLHYPKDLFYDCEEVRSLLGNFAPYAVPQAKSRKFSGDLGLKTHVTVDDALEVLQVMQNCKGPFTASIDQMSKFYAFLWGGMGTAKVEIARGSSSRSFIFLPFANSFRSGDIVSGRFFSSDEVYWHDPTGSLDLTKEKLLQRGSLSETDDTNKTLAFVYPALHDFFVNACKVCEIPPPRRYIQILVELSKVTLPSQAANAVLRVLLKWANDLKSGLLEPQDAAYLKESLLKLETTVLPTKQDKWVSLHPTFGLVCWCDSEELWKQFKHSDNIDFLYFGELNRDEKKVLPTKISGLMQTLGIPSLSEVITREAIFYGMDDSREKALLVNWALPYAQRYIYKLHPDKYTQLKQSGFDNICKLRVVIVEKLFYRHSVKGFDNASNKRVECSCLLQDNNMYIDRASTSHPVFMELSRLFFNGTPELHLANFLHMITTMAESGSTEEQTDLFVVNSQKIPKLPDEEPVWSLSSLLSQQEDGGNIQPSFIPLASDEQNQLKFKRKPGISSNWPPADWKTAPDFGFARENQYRTIPAVPQPTDSLQKEDDIEGYACTEDHGVPVGTCVDWIIEDKSIEHAAAVILQDLQDGSGQRFGKTSSSSGELHKADCAIVNSKILDRSIKERDQLSYGTPNEYQAALTGRLGEFVASRYFATKVDGATVNWVNEKIETGLPYDLVIVENGENKEYIEVKATKSQSKDWFTISTREWQFAVKKGDSYSIAHVFLASSNNAKVTVFRNPVRLCQQGGIRLAILMPKNQEDT